MLRSYAEIQRILNAIQVEVDAYLPGYQIKPYRAGDFPASSQGRKIMAANDGINLILWISIEYLEQAPLDKIMSSVSHEIAHTYNSDQRISQGHNEDWADTAKALGAVGNDSGFAPLMRQPRYIWRCADCGKEVISVYKTKLPAEFISPCPARTSTHGSHMNFYVKDEITRRIERVHPLSSQWAYRSH